MENKEINVCLTADNNYAEHMYVTVVSVIVNLSRNVNCNIWILDAWLSDDVKNMFLWLEIYKWIHVFFKEVDVTPYKKYPSFCWTYQTYFRLDIENIFTELDTLLYLDPDIIVNCDVSKLFDIDLSWYAIAAATAINTYYYYYYVLKIPKTYWYFNAWVVLMNLKYMRNNNISKKLFNYIDFNKDKLTSFDQDALNAVLFDKRLWLWWEYNVTALVWYKYYWKKNISKHPMIIHYWGLFKPRKSYCVHWLDYEYHYYRNLAWLKPLRFKTDIKRWYNSKKDELFWRGSLAFPLMFKMLAYIYFRLFNR